jgi:hypothetical protein
MRICNQCQFGSDDDDKFCTSCGASLSNKPQSTNTAKNKVPSKFDNIGNYVIIVIVLFVGSKLFGGNSDSSTDKTPIPSNYVSEDIKVTPEQAALIPKLIKASGYACDTLSSAIRPSYSGNFSVYCNGYKYSYDIDDIGGNWVVKVN